MFQEKSKETRKCSYLHLLIIVIEGYLEMIKSLKKMYKKGFYNEKYNYDFIKYSGCRFTVFKILELEEINEDTRNKISILRKKFFKASKLRRSLNTPLDIKQRFPLVLFKFTEIYQEYINLFLKELKRKGYHEKILSINKDNLNTFISFLLDKEHSKERDKKLQKLFKEIIEEKIVIKNKEIYDRRRKETKF